jgi:HAD superfamily hydrolase (TIGR01549 family)
VEVTYEDTTRSAAVLASVEGILLDFDGPVCALFANYSPRLTAAAARAEFSRRGIGLPRGLRETSGALVLVRWALLNAPDAAPAIEAIQEAGELQAVHTARPTPGAADAIVAAAGRGLKMAIVSNNSPRVVKEYISREGLASYIADVTGREAGNVNSLKPSPEPVLKAAVAISVPADRCVMIGDSASDIEAAIRAGSRSIGYACTRPEASALSAAGADAVISSMTTLASALENAPEAPRYR